MSPSRIIGAGLSGLIAAHAWPNAPIIEALPAPEPHRALLRFRSDKVAQLTGVEFKRVLVRKGLWSRGQYRLPTIALANNYSVKVVGRVTGDRSIWTLEPVERWIAPEDFQDRLLDHVRARTTFGASDDMQGDKPFISTAPMHATLRTLGICTNANFDRSAIEVQRYRVPRCDANQTVYFPDRDTSLYRASITGDILILESTKGVVNFGELVSSAFGIDFDECVPLDRATQKFGKIIGLPDAQRRSLMFKLTSEYGLYSLGRFAQWRNILLDDVVQDINVIKKLMASDLYQLRKAAS